MFCPDAVSTWGEAAGIANAPGKRCPVCAEVRFSGCGQSSPVRRPGTSSRFPPFVHQHLPPGDHPTSLSLQCISANQVDQSVYSSVVRVPACLIAPGRWKKESRGGSASLTTSVPKNPVPHRYVRGDYEVDNRVVREWTKGGQRHRTTLSSLPPSSS
jgi:hypothetical protein